MSIILSAGVTPARLWLGAIAGYLLCQVILIPFTIAVATAQEPHGGIDDIRAVYAHLSAACAGSNSISVKYTVRSVKRDTVHRLASETTIDARMSRSVLYAKSSEFESFRDTSVSITAINATKTIYVLDVPGNRNTAASDPFALLRDSLLLHAKLVSSVVEAGAYGDSLERITLEIPERDRDRSGANSLTFLIDSRKLALYSITVDYIPALPVQTTTITFDDIQYHHDEADVAEIAAGFGKDIISALQARYQGYRIVDQRMNRHHS